MTGASHDVLADLLAVHALDAVSVEEAELVERHLDVCPRCRAELRDHREVAGLLGAMGGEAPPGLWDQIAAEASDAPPALQLVRRGAETGSDAARPGRAHRSLSLRLVAGAAAVAAALVAVLGVEVSRLNDRTQHLDSVVASMGPAATMATVRQALATPGALQVHLTSLTGTTRSLRAVVLPSGQGYLYDAQLDPIPSDHTYQLWGVVNGQSISYGLLGSDPSTVLAFRAGPGLLALAVTDEVAGGVEQSYQPFVVAGQVQPSRPAAT